MTESKDLVCGIASCISILMSEYVNDLDSAIFILRDSNIPLDDFLNSKKIDDNDKKAVRKVFKVMDSHFII